MTNDLRKALAQPSDSVEQEPVCAHGVGKAKCGFCMQPEQEAFTLDRGCWERGCVAYDERDGDGVTVSKHSWVGLTDEEVKKCYDSENPVEAAEDRLRQKNDMPNL
jgi:hypothetical protein